MYERGVGVLYLDGGANVIAKNSKAEEILDSCSRFWCSGKRLCFEDNEVKDTFFCKLDEIRNSNSSTSMFVKKALNMSPIRVNAFPIFDNIYNQKGEKPCWVLLVNDTEHKPILSAKSMAEFYGLTNAELALVSAIYDGLNLAEYAEQRGVKITTVRWTLDNVFSKTYTHSQSQLKELANKFVE